MPILSVRMVLLLTMVPFLSVAGRHLPGAAAPITASLAPTPHVQLTTPGITFGVNWDRSISQDLIPTPPSRKLFRGLAKDSIYGRHRRLVGSSPPSCQGKCGSCVPCTPIHTSVASASAGSTSGSVTQQEYYPEVWRCKCGNKLFAP